MKEVPTTPAGLIRLILEDASGSAGALRRHHEYMARAVGQSQARWQVLSAVSAEPRTVPQIARRLGVTRQAVQRLADILVREELATFEANPDHRGSPHLVPTEPGKATLARMNEAADAYHRAIAGQLEAGELRDMHAGLRRLIAALDRVAPDDRPIDPAETALES
jgi:DNA-binding MarR family transcriptional regulator